MSRRVLHAGTTLVTSLALAVGLALVAAGTGSGIDQRVIRGTSGVDKLRGTTANDRILGLDGNDTLYGAAGNDILTGGFGRDVVRGGPGNDRLFLRDGERDVARCGPGRDTVYADTTDQLGKDCEARLRKAVPPPEPPMPPPSGETVELVDESWTCTGAVNLDLVKVSIGPNAADRDAIHLRKNCSGWIRRIEVNTWRGDGVKINATAPAAHDLVIAGGYIRCFDHPAGTHQDGVQALGGERITFRNVEINCNSQPNAQFFVNGAQGGVPTDIVCERCFLGHGAATTIRVRDSIRSGARDSTICVGRFHTVVFLAEAVDPVNIRNTVLPSTDARC